IEILQINATGAIAEEMLKDEKRMIMLGAQVVQDSATNQTLGAKEIESNASTSQLKRIACNISAALTWCATQAAEFMGVNDEVKVMVNDQFVTDNLTAQDVTAMFALYQAGAATLDELNSIKRKAGYTTKSNEELAEDLEDEAPTQGDNEEVAMLKMEIDNLREQLSNQGGE
ncbi:MAG: DUF4055 domain-containing protein, partial [Desulfobacterales bacterium]|nr:DUF4055 domain-containing protein [Desulfobacterales bacterium]